MLNQGWFKATYTELIWDNLEGEWTDEFKLIKCFEDQKYFFNVLNILHNILYLVENIFTQEKFCGFADPETALRAAQKFILLVWVFRLSQLSVALQYLADQWKRNVSVAVPGLLRKCPRHITRPGTQKAFLMRTCPWELQPNQRS